jgi:hypothetical protein
VEQGEKTDRRSVGAKGTTAGAGSEVNGSDGSGTAGVVIIPIRATSGAALAQVRQLQSVVVWGEDVEEAD